MSLLFSILKWKASISRKEPGRTQTHTHSPGRTQTHTHSPLLHETAKRL